MHLLLKHLAAWISATPTSLWLQRQAWVIIVSQSIHIVCVAVVFGSVVVISLRLLGVSSTGRSVSQLVNTLVPWILRALLVLFLTGVQQTWAEPYRQFGAEVFFWKMGLIVVTLTMTIVFARAVRARAAVWNDATARPAGAKVFAVVWMALWMGIVWCGRFIGYA